MGLIYPRPFEFLLTDDGTPTGNSNFVGDYSVTALDAWFDAESLQCRWFAVTGLKVQLIEGPTPPIGGYGVLATLSGAHGPLFWHESDTTPRYSPDSFWEGNTNYFMRISTGDRCKSADNEFAFARLHVLEYMRRAGKPYIFRVSPGAKFGVNIVGDFTTDPGFIVHRFLVTGFCVDNPEAWSL